jgi:hypothetical protein
MFVDTQITKQGAERLKKTLPGTHLEVGKRNCPSGDIKELWARRP